MGQWFILGIGPSLQQPLLWAAIGSWVIVNRAIGKLFFLASIQRSLILLGGYGWPLKGPFGSSVRMSTRCMTSTLKKTPSPRPGTAARCDLATGQLRRRHSDHAAHPFGPVECPLAYHLLGDAGVPAAVLLGAMHRVSGHGWHPGGPAVQHGVLDTALA